jgi:hypothetical protein
MPGTEVSPNAPASTAAPIVDQKGGRRSGVTVKALKRTLKKAGLKTSGKKATLRARAKKARLMGGSDEKEEVMGGKRRSRKSRGFRLY